MIKDQADAFKRDQAIGKLVLDRLELCDRLPELVTLLGIVHGQFERLPGRAVRAPQKCQLGLEADIVGIGAFERNKGQRHRIQPHLAEPPGAHGARRREDNAGSIQLNEGKAGLVNGHDKVCGIGRLDKTKHACSVRAFNPDRSCTCIRIAGAEGKCSHSSAGVQLFQ